jgi:hypothetical protein
MERIGSYVMEALSPPSLLSPESAIRHCDFHIEWDLSVYCVPFFDRHQTYLHTLGEYAAITSNGLNTQAASGSEYMLQTWPDTGPHTLTVVRHAIELYMKDPKSTNTDIR